MYLAWVKYWPAHTYDRLGVSIHLHYEAIALFTKKRFEEIRENNPHPPDGFGKPKIIEIDGELLNEITAKESYMPIEKYEQLIAAGRIICDEVVLEKITNPLRIESCGD